jgi:hypothetical protein
VNTNTQKSEQVEFGFLLKWILASTIGWIVISSMGYGVRFDGDNNQFDIAWISMWCVGGVIGGTIGGFA